MQTLVPQPVTINFSQGLNLKADPWQVPIGQFLILENSVFTTAGQLKKRNGYDLLTTIDGAATITTYLGNLISLSTSLDVFSQDSNSVINTGQIQPMALSVLPMVRRATAQQTVDLAIAPNGLSLSVWKDSDGDSYYQINDSVTGGTIVPSVAITTGTDVGATSGRVNVLGNYWIITYVATVSSNATLRYIAIPWGNPTMAMAPVTVSTAITNINAAYDAIAVQVNQGILYLAWADSTVIKIVEITAGLISGSAITLTSASASLISLAFDYVALQLWISFYDSGGSNINTAMYSYQLAPLLAITNVVSSITVENGLTSTATSGVVKIFYEVSNFYGYDNTLRTDYLAANTCTSGGTAGSPATILRSVGIASKAALVNGVNYLLVTYSSVYQPTYFLITESGKIIGKVAYSNGGGYYLTQIQPQINVTTVNGESVFNIGYLFKDFLASIANPVGPLGTNVGTNKTMGASPPPIYTQTGINLSTCTFGTQVPNIETGSILHMGVGYPKMFDGVAPVEHQFHVWPDAIEVATATTGGGLDPQQYYYQGIYAWTDGQGNPQYSAPSVPVGIVTTVGSPVTFTSHFSAGDTVLTVSSVTGLFAGQTITDTSTGGNIAAGTIILSISGSTITLSKPAAGNSAGGGGDTLQVTQIGKNTVYFPTLRLTDKTGVNKVRLQLYRWSTLNQNFYEYTSVSSPTLNDPTIDYVTFTDKTNDSELVGNSLIYTTGGVVEDIAAPSFSISSMFDDRLWIVSAEDGTLWYSKQVIPGTGVEFSNLFTYYVAPNQGAQGSTGLPTALCPMDTELIVFKKDAMFYINGAGPDNTGANSTYSQPIYISSTVGCANPNSIVQTDDGIMFQSDKGIWLLSRSLQPVYIGQAVERAVIGNTVLQANIIPGTTQARFIMNTGVTLMYDYFYKQWGTFTNTPGISATIYQGLHTYLDEYGRILQESPDFYLDVSTPVTMRFVSGWIQLQGLQGYQRFLEMQLLGSYISPHLLNVEFAYDFGPLSDQAEIQPINQTGDYGSDAYYGQTSPYGGQGQLEQWRIQNSTMQCQSFQVSMQEVYDTSQENMAGAGLTLSAFTAIIGVTRTYRPSKAATTVGTTSG